MSIEPKKYVCFVLPLESAYLIRVLKKVKYAVGIFDPLSPSNPTVEDLVKLLKKA
jgi:hypothetical protein